MRCFRWFSHTAVGGSNVLCFINSGCRIHTQETQKAINLQSLMFTHMYQLQRRRSKSNNLFSFKGLKARKVSFPIEFLQYPFSKQNSSCQYNFFWLTSTFHHLWPFKAAKKDSFEKVNTLKCYTWHFFAIDTKFQTFFLLIILLEVKYKYYLGYSCGFRDTNLNTRF